MQTAEQVKQKLIELEKNYRIEHNLLIEEYKKLSPIQVGDKVKVTHKRGDVELGECVDIRIGYQYKIEPILHKLKKNGNVSLRDVLYMYPYSILEKL